MILICFCSYFCRNRNLFRYDMEEKRISLPEGFSPEERAAEAKANFLAGYNCCQSVLLAYCDIFGIGRQTAAVMSSGFGGGMARMREVCGTVSAMVMAAGFISPADDPSIKSARTANYALVQELAEKFREEHGTIVCRELLGLSGNGIRPSSSRPFESPVPSDRTAEYYRKRPCADLVYSSALIIGRKLLEMSFQE